MILRPVILIFSLLVGVAASQLPEFAQQYRQRLAGAVDELTRIVERFDADARAEGLTQDQALERYRQSGDGFLRRQGGSAAEVIARRDRLLAQQQELAGAPFARIAPVVAHLDSELARRTLNDFEPAVPTTVEGAAFGGAGVVFGRLLASLLGLSPRRRRRTA